MANVLVIGSGGREHALALMLSRSVHIERLYCAPGNAGTAEIAVNLNVDPSDHQALITTARGHKIDLTVVGPEAPLCDGVVDAFTAAGLCAFGPTAAAARIEGDKGYAKKLMKIANVPTAEGRVFKDYRAAHDFIATRDTGVVVKACGLAAGKGVVVCPDPADGLRAAERMMVDRAFGDAGRKIVVEELLKGPELSVFALVCGHTIYVLETAQDHKSIGEGDTGPNTGGMGAYSPAQIATEEVLAVVERDVLVPIVDALENEGRPYRGLLYVGLMLTPGGPKVLEFNCRFGDPETQAVLPRLESDLFELFDATVHNRLDEIELHWDPRPAVCVVMASQGYPGGYSTGKVIEGIEQVRNMSDIHIFHAGTHRVDQKFVTSGGRVLSITALGDTIEAARQRTYEAVEKIRFEGAYYRRDIARRTITKQRS